MENKFSAAWTCFSARFGVFLPLNRSPLRAAPNQVCARELRFNVPATFDLYSEHGVCASVRGIFTVKSLRNQCSRRAGSPGNGALVDARLGYLLSPFTDYALVFLSIIKALERSKEGLRSKIEEGSRGVSWR